MQLLALSLSLSLLIVHLLLLLLVCDKIGRQIAISILMQLHEMIEIEII
jgi:hypothetical protein